MNELSEIFLKIAEAPKENQQRLLAELCPDQELREKVRQLLDADLCADPLLDHSLFPEPVEVKPGETISCYRLLSELAQGGMGVVFLAEQFEPVRRKVALKVIKPGVDTRQVIARFDAERQALSLMDHPNIAKVLDAGSTEAGRPFFVMELVDGQPVTTFCVQNRLTINQRLELFVSVCRAIQHAHQKGVIHRDIKPSNVLVAQYDGQPVAKVIDFGVAKAINHRLTEVTIATGLGQIVGTVDYMSPEQSRTSQDDVDTRSDIYSLGVLLYELLTDTPPFDRDRLRSVDLDEMLSIIREEDPPRPSVRLIETPNQDWTDTPTLLPGEKNDSSNRQKSGSRLKRLSRKQQNQPAKRSRVVRGDLDWIVMRAIDKDRNRRYATPIELANDIERFLSGEPVTACPPSPLYRFSKFTKRNRTALITSGIVAVSLVLGSVGVAYQAVRASRAEANANIAAFEFLIENVLGSENNQTIAGYSPDPDLKLLILLKNANDRVDEHFAEEPALRAKMKGTLASLFNNAGQYEDAARLYRDYLKYLKANNGSADSNTIRVMRHLVRIHIDESNLRDAERLGNEALSSSRLYLGEQHEVTLLLLNDLAMLYHKQGENQRAVDSYRQVLEARQRLLGDSHPDTLVTMSSLATVYDSINRFDEAQELHERVLDSYQETLSPDDARLAAALHNLGRCCLQRGRRIESNTQFEKAAMLLSRSLQIYTDNRGNDHTNTLECKYGLAQAYTELQELDRSRPLLEDLVARLERLREPDDWMTLEAMNMLGWTYMHQSQFAEAEYLLTNAYEQLGRLSPRDYLTLQVMGNLAIVRFRMGKLDEAISLDEKTSRLSAEILGPDHIQTRAAKERLALGYRDQGRDSDSRVPNP